MSNKAPFYIAFACFIISFLFGAVAFSTGYWYEGAGEGRLFERLGLWEACFNGYEHTSDYIGKAYYGCWWIFHKEYSYIREWILPPWFVAVQTLMTFALVMHIAGLILYPMARKQYDSVRKQATACIISIICALCIGISVVVFGTMIGEDRTWMPRWDIDVLGFSFGCAVVSGFFAWFASISMVVYTLMRKYELLPQELPPHESMKGSMQISMKPKV